MVDYTYTYSASKLQEHHDTVESSLPVVNRLQGNQNFNVIGKDGNPVPNGIAEVYPIGEEIAAGIVAITECTITKTVDLISGTGTYGRTIDGEFPDDFYGVKLADFTISQTGVSLIASAGETTTSVDLAVAGPHKFPLMSEQKGVAPDISDDESTNAAYNQLVRNATWSNVSVDRSVGVEYINETAIVRKVFLTFGNVGTSITVNSLPLGGFLYSGPGLTDSAFFEVPPGQTYEVGGSFVAWLELGI